MNCFALASVLTLLINYQYNKDSRFNEDDFEFALVKEDSANEIILDGKIRPIFRIFSYFESSPSRCKKSNSTGSTPKRWSFLNLLWRSNSDGKDSLVFLTPKNRGGKSVNIEKVENLKSRRNFDVVQVAGKVKPKGVSGGEKSSAHEAFYIQNRAKKEGYKKKSYLPYRQDLVGFFANVGALGPAANFECLLVQEKAEQRKGEGLSWVAMEIYRRKKVSAENEVKKNGKKKMRVWTRGYFRQIKMILTVKDRKR